MKALVSLDAATARPRETGEHADEIKLERYVAKLRDYPADIALHVLATWDDQPPPRGTFFPRWAELKQSLDAAFAFRRQVLPALQAFDTKPEPVEEIDPEQRAADVAEVKRLAATFAKSVGRRSKFDRDVFGDAKVDPPPTREERKTLTASMLEQARERDAAEIERQLHPERN